MVSRRVSCRGAEAWKVRVNGRHLEACGVTELRESNWHVGCRSSREDSIL
jgi:hypothetical protein